MGFSKNRVPKLQQRFQAFVESQIPGVNVKKSQFLLTLKNSKKKTTTTYDFDLI